jgi:CRISPR/Cas system endoribonuclease Cas6 (RAMP superfamily)
MDGFVVKKARVKESPSLEVFKPPPRISPVIVDLCPEKNDTGMREEELDDHDEFFNEHWEKNAQKRKEHREKREKLESAPRTMLDHFKKK